MKTKKKVKVSDPYLSARLLNDLLTKKGYKVCDNHGIVCENLYPNSVGLVRPATPSTGRFFGIIPYRVRGTFLGMIYGLNTGEWLFKVNGYENLADMTVLAEEIQEYFGIPITVELVSEESYQEHYYGDFSDPR